MAEGDFLDAVIVGGGPAGLTAAIYLARFRRRFALFHDGRSRAAWIPRTRNHPGFPDGIIGADLLQRMTDQALGFGAALIEGSVTSLCREGEGEDAVFVLTAAERELRARTVLLATGVADTLPDLAGAEAAVVRSLLRICPICDAFEIIGQPVAVIGDSGPGAREAAFLTTYSQDITLLHVGPSDALDINERRRLEALGVTVLDTSLAHITLRTDLGIALCEAEGGQRVFNAVYSALGVTPRSGLAEQAGVRTADDGRLWVDDHQQTSVPGLYAAGDMVRGLNQISTAEGEAATAATAIHNKLRRGL
jgi:thioredoxin reductase (NADPH)